MSIIIVYNLVKHTLFLVVNKSKDSPVDTAKKKAELEKRLQDVSGQLSGTKSKSKKNAGKHNKLNIVCMYEHILYTC